MKVLQSAELSINSLEHEVSILNIGVNIIPDNNHEGIKILGNFILGTAKSIVTMSPSTELIDSLKKGISFGANKINNRNQKKIYTMIYYLDSLSQTIITSIENS